MIVVYGGAGSGKSAYGERRVLQMARERRAKPVYLACMPIRTKEDEEVAARHRRMREGKGFVTLEIPLFLKDAPLSGKEIVLLECLGTLMSNAMFSWEEGEYAVRSPEDSLELIWQELLALERKAGELFVVANDIFAYSPGEQENLTGEMNGYIRAMKVLLVCLFGYAKEVKEVVCGIPFDRMG